ncbi:MAG: hypothetical protein ABUK20_05445 [Anaerolineales bacterium]
MLKNQFKIVWLLIVLVGLSLACQSLSAIEDDYNQARGTAGAIATQAQGIITQAEGFATQVVDSKAFETVQAIATQQGPAYIATGQALATKAADEGYLQTVEALITQGSSELLPTFQAVATQYLFRGPPPDDIPIISDGELTNLLTNQSTISYYVTVDLTQVVDFYQTTMPEHDWVDVTDSNLIKADAAVLKFFKPEQVATITLTANPISQQTVVLIFIRSQ